MATQCVSLTVSPLGWAVRGIVVLTPVSPPVLADSQRSSVASRQTCTHNKTAVKRLVIKHYVLGADILGGIHGHAEHAIFDVGVYRHTTTIPET